MSELIQNLVNALAVGSSYALLAIGLAIVFNILRMINFAHGELLTVTGFALYLGIRAGVPWVVLIPLALTVPTLVAVLMERLAFRPVRGSEMTTTLVTSFALSLVLQSLLLTWFGARPIAVPFPSWVTSNVTIGGIRVQALQIFTTVVTVLALGALTLFFRRARLGTAMRAATDDFAVARLMGIRANMIVALAFAISGLAAGIAGILWVARRGTVDPFMGLVPVVNAFVAAVIGGLGSLAGAVVAGFLLGLIRVTLEVTLSPASLRYIDAFTMGLVIVVLLVRPEGILTRRSAA